MAKEQGSGEGAIAPPQSVTGVRDICPACERPLAASPWAECLGCGWSAQRAGSGGAGQ